MKTMTCKELGGSCDMKFSGNTFKEVVMLNKLHTKEMYDTKDPVHLEGSKKLEELLKSPKDMLAWVVATKARFDALEDDK